jgi:hypothetical protein
VPREIAACTIANSEVDVNLQHGCPPRPAGAVVIEIEWIIQGAFPAGIQVVRIAIVHNLAGLFHDTWMRQVTSSGSVAHRHLSGFTSACIDAR